MASISLIQPLASLATEQAFFQKLNHRLTMRQRRKSVLTFIEEWWQFSCDTTGWGICDNPIGFQSTWQGEQYPLCYLQSLYIYCSKDNNRMLMLSSRYLLKCYSGYKQGIIKLLCSLSWCKRYCSL